MAVYSRYRRGLLACVCLRLQTDRRDSGFPFGVEATKKDAIDSLTFIDLVGPQGGLLVVHGGTQYFKRTEDVVFSNLAIREWHSHFIAGRYGWPRVAEYRYALAPHANEFTNADRLRSVEAFDQPPLCVVEPLHAGRLAKQRSFASVDSKGILISSLRAVGDGVCEVRVVEQDGLAATTQLRLDVPAIDLRLVIFWAERQATIGRWTRERLPCRLPRGRCGRSDWSDRHIIDRNKSTENGRGTMKRRTMRLVFACLIAAAWPAGSRAQQGPDPVFEKPLPVTMAELAKRTTQGVSALEVNDYAPGHYTGGLTPSPPHADMNAKKAVVVFWKDHPQRFIFSHEASYCPLLELSSGAAMCNQFFEGNTGNAELFNIMGRKEKNSFVDVIQSGPERVWVRWNYFAVNMKDDTQPRLRGTEDYIAYPNGLVLRRLTYESLMPNSIYGYSQQPVELFGVAPVGKDIKDLFPRDAQRGDYHTHAVLDIYSDRRYDIYWGENGEVRRRGDDTTLAAISQSPGRALVLPFREGLLFAVLGDAGGFPGRRAS